MLRTPYVLIICYMCMGENIMYGRHCTKEFAKSTVFDSDWTVLNIVVSCCGDFRA